jgi:hypothetical protein
MFGSAKVSRRVSTGHAGVRALHWIVIVNRLYRKFLLFGSLPLILAVFSFAGAHKYANVVPRQDSTRGIIMEHEPKNHDRYRYSFRLEGRDYTGWDSPSSGNFQIGESVWVYYDRLQPSNNNLNGFVMGRDRNLQTGFFELFFGLGVSAFGPVDPASGKFGSQRAARLTA